LFRDLAKTPGVVRAIPAPPRNAALVVSRDMPALPAKTAHERESAEDHGC
jgi:hypothetical protein